MTEDRRSDDRRDSERRTFRTETGRRDGSGPGRRRGLRRWLRPALFALLAASVLFGWRSVFVAPQRAADARLADLAPRVEPLLERTTLSLLALPGTAGPREGDPGEDIAELSPAERDLLVDAEAELAPLLRSAPGNADVPMLLGTMQLLAGREADARASWETALAEGDELVAAQAHIGLAVIALRRGLRVDPSADARFAYDQALRYLGGVGGPSALHSDVRFNRVVALALLGRFDEASSEVERLPPARVALLKPWLESREQETVDDGS